MVKAIGKIKAEPLINITAQIGSRCRYSMRRNIKLTFFLFFLILPTWALSIKLDNWTFSELSPIEVRLFDFATGGCWTNIGEVQTYIEDKLQMNGADLIQSNGELFSSEVRLGEAAVFTVHVKAERNSIGFCWGTLDINFMIWDEYKRIHGFFNFYHDAQPLMQIDNLNTAILHVAGERLRSLL